MRPTSSSIRTLTILSAFALVLFATLPSLRGQVLDVEQMAAESQLRLIAAIAEVDGSRLRRQLLNSANNENLAKWYNGQIDVDGNWTSTDDAAQLAESNEALIEYRVLRSRALDSLEDHERLARWSRKRDLVELADMHWLHVLRFDSSDRRALEELSLTWHHGILVTEEEAEAMQDRDRQQRKQSKKWIGKIRKLRKDLENEDPVVVAAGRNALLQINEPEALPALLEEFAKPAKSEAKTIARNSHLMPALGNIASTQATELLAMTAVEATDETIRYAAINELKAKPYETYIPTLLAELAMPIDGSVNIQTAGRAVVSSYTYSQEQPGGDQHTENRRNYNYVPGRQYVSVPLYRRGAYVPPKTIPDKVYQRPIHPGHGRMRVPTGPCSGGWRWQYVPGALEDYVVPGREVPGYYEMELAGFRAIEDPTFASRREATVQQSQRKAQQAQVDLNRRNEAIQRHNQRVGAVLTEVTGERLSAFPKSWWNWWSDYLDQHPDAATAGTRQQLNAALLNQQPRGLARGTWVWTRRGKRHVEDVLPGDFVLAQDPRTGELDYKVVVAIARPQQLAVSKLDVADNQIHCAPGHVVWVTGSGWQRVSKLQANHSLHTVQTEAPVADVDKAFTIDSYDLIVDGFHTFFIGEQGVLVHDATPIRPTYAALPGFSPAAVAHAAQLAAK